jgi:hypothetical protein
MKLNRRMKLHDADRAKARLGSLHRAAASGGYGCLGHPGARASGLVEAARHGGGGMTVANRRDLRGQRNGRLVAVEPSGIANDSHVLWRCVCDCGGERVISSNNFREAGTKSCGCLRREAAIARIKRDGAWNNGKSYAINAGERCYKTRHSWAKAAIRAYGNKCEICGWAEARCDVHHRELKSEGGLHTLANAIVLCPNCHRIEHDRKRA